MSKLRLQEFRSRAQSRIPEVGDIIKGKEILEVTYHPDAKNYYQKYKCLYKCSCGNLCLTNFGAVKNSAHCRRCSKEQSIHSQSNTKPYRAWAHIKRRARLEGILIDPNWVKRREGFIFFLEDLGFPPSDKHFLRRIDPNGDYNASNCKWMNIRPTQKHEEWEKTVKYPLPKPEERKGVVIVSKCHKDYLWERDQGVVFYTCTVCGIQKRDSLGNFRKYSFSKCMHRNIIATKEYRTWQNLRARSKKPSYKSGDIPRSWLQSIDNFIKDMGYAPDPKGSYRFRRIDKSIPFSKTNCEWRHVHSVRTPKK